VLREVRLLFTRANMLNRRFSMCSVPVKITLFRSLPARRYASAGNSDRNVSVRPSVRLSRAGIVSKRRKLAA